MPTIEFQDGTRFDFNPYHGPTGRFAPAPGTRAPFTTAHTVAGLRAMPQIEFKAGSNPNLNVPSKVLADQEHFPDLDAEVAQAISSGDLVMRLEPSSLAALAKSGEFLNQHQIKKSGGNYDPAMRKAFEDRIAGINSDNPRDYPKYAYVDVKGGTAVDGLKASSNALSQYGDIEVVFRPETKARTTVSFGDSLDTMQARHRMVAEESKTTDSYVRLLGDAAKPIHVAGALTPMLKPKHTAAYYDHAEQVGGKRRDPTALGYMEAQVYGKLGLDDVAGFKVMGKNHAEKIQKLFPGKQVTPSESKIPPEKASHYGLGADQQTLSRWSDKSLYDVAETAGMLKSNYGPSAKVRTLMTKEQFDILPKTEKAARIVQHVSEVKAVLAKRSKDKNYDDLEVSVNGIPGRNDSRLVWKSLDQAVSKGTRMVKDYGELYNNP